MLFLIQSEIDENYSDTEVDPNLSESCDWLFFIWNKGCHNKSPSIDALPNIVQVGCFCQHKQKKSVHPNFFQTFYCTPSVGNRQQEVGVSWCENATDRCLKNFPQVMFMLHLVLLCNTLYSPLIHQCMIFYLHKSHRHRGPSLLFLYAFHLKPHDYVAWAWHRNFPDERFSCKSQNLENVWA